jgi:integral membrane protein
MNGVITRFRIMAIWAGGMSLLLWFIYMPAKYLVSDESFYERFIWIPIVHGFTYPIYLLAALHLCIMKRKTLISTCLFLLAGTLPVASIWIERSVAKER